jgi:hypothetical protein
MKEEISQTYMDVRVSGASLKVPLVIEEYGDETLIYWGEMLRDRLSYLDLMAMVVAVSQQIQSTGDEDFELVTSAVIESCERSFENKPVKDGRARLSGVIVYPQKGVIGSVIVTDTVNNITRMYGKDLEIRKTS